MIFWSAIIGFFVSLSANATDFSLKIPPQKPPGNNLKLTISSGGMAFTKEPPTPPPISLMKQVISVDQWPWLRAMPVQTRHWYPCDLVSNYVSETTDVDEVSQLIPGFTEMHFKSQDPKKDLKLKVYRTRLYLNDKHVCDMILPKKTVKAKRWLECDSKGCQEKTSATEVELKVPVIEDYAYYAVGSTESAQTPCEVEGVYLRGGKLLMLDYGIWSSPTYCDVTDGNKKILGEGIDGGCQGVIELMSVDLGFHGIKRYMSLWERTLRSFPLDEVASLYVPEELGECHKKGLDVCLKAHPWLKAAACPKGKCVSADELRIIVRKMSECRSRYFPETDILATVTDAGEFCTTDYDRVNKRHYVTGFVHPASVWHMTINKNKEEPSELDFIVEKFNSQHPIIVVPEQP